MRLVGIIVIYHPNTFQFLGNIEKLMPHLDGLIVFKNSILKVEDDLKEFYGDKILITGDCVNVGISKALNDSIALAKLNSFTHILTLDQDSYFLNDHLSRFRSLVDAAFVDEKVGVCAPNFLNDGNLHLQDGVSVVEVSDVITSGSIYPIQIFGKVGGFDNDLFIDCVDFEFCYRIRAFYGYKILLFPEIILIHELGYSKKSVLGFFTINYSAFRTFYLVRNHILIWRKYPRFYRREYKYALIKEYILYRIIKVVFIEDNKISKIKAIIRGVWIGLRNKI